MPMFKDVGSYTTKDGKVIATKDLPDDVRKEVESQAGLRSLAMQGGDTKKAYEYQRKINRLYDPATRDYDMDAIDGGNRGARRVAAEITARLEQRDKKKR